MWLRITPIQDSNMIHFKRAYLKADKTCCGNLCPTNKNYNIFIAFNRIFCENRDRFFWILQIKEKWKDLQRWTYIEVVFPSLGLQQPSGKEESKIMVQTQSTTCARMSSNFLTSSSHRLPISKAQLRIERGGVIQKINRNANCFLELRI